MTWGFVFMTRYIGIFDPVPWGRLHPWYLEGVVGTIAVLGE